MNSVLLVGLFAVIQLTSWVYEVSPAPLEEVPSVSDRYELEPIRTLPTTIGVQPGAAIGVVTEE